LYWLVDICMVVASKKSFPPDGRSFREKSTCKSLAAEDEAQQVIVVGEIGNNSV
jgi:hypothetical protein